MERMARRNVLITGCSSGIGFALAVKMAKDEQKRFKGNNISVIYLYKKYSSRQYCFFLCDLTGDCTQFGDLFLVSFPSPTVMKMQYSKNILLSVSRCCFCSCIEAEQLLELNSLQRKRKAKPLVQKQIAENV